MNVGHERNRLNGMLQQASRRTREGYLANFDELAAVYADPDITAEERPVVEGRIQQVLENASHVNTSGFWTITTAAFSALVVIFFFGGIALYMSALKEPISSVRATRPILVFTLIVAMLGFGGLLMVRSLFGVDDSEHLERRFRLAREIFLVYAGIFGTIIGFYFGAADEGEINNPPSMNIAVRDHTMTAQVNGGAAPFTAYLSREDPPLDLLMEGADRLMTLDLGNALSQCPVGGTVTVIDGQGRRASADVVPEAIIGWDACKTWNQVLPGTTAATAQNSSGRSIAPTTSR